MWLVAAVVVVVAQRALHKGEGPSRVVVAVAAGRCWRWERAAEAGRAVAEGVAGLRFCRFLRAVGRFDKAGTWAEPDDAHGRQGHRTDGACPQAVGRRHQAAQQGVGTGLFQVEWKVANLDRGRMGVAVGVMGWTEL